jgi:hypothetical protein
LHCGPDPLGGRPADCTGGAGGADQVEKMRPLGLIELEGASNAVDDALRDSGGVATLKPRVVLARDPRQNGDLVAA